MRSFRYLADPLFLLGCGAYALNRWGLKPHWSAGFLHSHFNDLWLIPCALPPVLWVQSWLKLRPPESPPQFREILFHVILWSVLFEGLEPLLRARSTADIRDVLAYLIGGILAGLWWRYAYRARPAT
ncbi:MAG: hypothetical protein M9920_13585 [Verrucomicrobiae bacterium]|nr:hypothetical protein [Verrucomicrobiae bacterium]